MTKKTLTTKKEAKKSSKNKKAFNLLLPQG
jgi:hypothetical protein